MNDDSKKVRIMIGLKESGIQISIAKQLFLVHKWLI